MTFPGEKTPCPLPKAAAMLNLPLGTAERAWYVSHTCSRHSVRARGGEVTKAGVKRTRGI